MKAHKGQFFAVFLFSAYINDLPEVFLNEIFFADNTKIVGLENHQQILQNDIVSAITWSEKNDSNFNFTKFNFIKFSLQNLADQKLSFQAREHQIERDKSIRDLGVNFSKNFSGNFHNDVIVKKGLKKLAHILRVMPA